MSTARCGICDSTVQFARMYVTRCKHEFHSSCIETWINVEEKRFCPQCHVYLSNSDFLNLIEPCVMCRTLDLTIDQKICHSCRRHLSVLKRFYEPLTLESKWAFVRTLQSNLQKSPEDGERFSTQLEEKLFVFLKLQASALFNFKKYFEIFKDFCGVELKLCFQMLRFFSEMRTKRQRFEKTTNVMTIRAYLDDCWECRLLRNSFPIEDDEFNGYVRVLGEYCRFLVEMQHSSHVRSQSFDVWRGTERVVCMFVQYENDVVRKTLLPFFESIGIEKFAAFRDFVEVYKANNRPEITLSDLRKRLDRFKELVEREEMHPETLEKLFEQSSK